MVTVAAQLAGDRLVVLPLLGDPRPGLAGRRTAAAVDEPDRTGAAVATAVTRAAGAATDRGRRAADRDPRRARRGPRSARRGPRASGSPFRVNTAVVIASGLMVVTGLVALFGLFLFVGSGLAANRDQDVMYDELKEQLGLATVPVNGAIPTGTPIGIVEIPRLGLEQVFVEGSASEQTIKGPGLRHDTVLPGQAGASVLVGRRATFGAAVRRPRPARARRPDQGHHRPGRVHLRRRPGAHQRLARRTDRAGPRPAHAGHLRPGDHADPQPPGLRPAGR